MPKLVITVECDTEHQLALVRKRAIDAVENELRVERLVSQTARVYWDTKTG